MKKLANLKGVKNLNKEEQKRVNGGALTCEHVYCIWVCYKGHCIGPDLS